MCTAMPSLYVNAGDPNAEPHAEKILCPLSHYPISLLVLSYSNRTFLLCVYGLPYKFYYLFYQKDVLGFATGK